MKSATLSLVMVCAVMSPAFASDPHLGGPYGLTQAEQDFADRLYNGSPLSDEATIRRAGAWGRCVVAAAPTESIDYMLAPDVVSARRHSKPLSGVFAKCRRESGAFRAYKQTAVRQAAIRDALRAKAPRSET